jgi:hypothetical protein
VGFQDIVGHKSLLLPGLNDVHSIEGEATVCLGLEKEKL